MLEMKGNYVNFNIEFSAVQNYAYEGDGNLEDFGVLRNNPSNQSVYILQSRENKKMAYRIYKDFKRKTFDQARDAILIQRLHENGYRINDIDFPYGVITMDNRVIGQAIPDYEQSCALADFESSVITLSTLLADAYSLIKELYDHDIYYLDIHEYNFLVTPEGLKLIDFDNEMTYFINNKSKEEKEKLKALYERHIVKSFKSMAHFLLSCRYGLSIDQAHTMEELGEEVFNLQENRPKIKIKKWGLNS